MHEFTNSSFLAGASYDKETSVMTVHFRNGKEYKFADVLEETYKEFCEAPSAGIYFSANIKGKFEPPKE